MQQKPKQPKQVTTLTHEEASRKNIPTAEYRSVMDEQDRSPIRVAYQRRNRDLDPQLVWRGKDQQDESDLVVNAPPLYIQEKVHPKALIDELQRESREREFDAGQITPDLFSDFNGLPKGADRTDFYQYDGNWQNRPILGDSLQVMASLAEREGLRSKVQCIYLDPPYGIKFNSNFQWSTTSRDVKDGKAEHITREPEQVKAFRDTWRDGIHSYLTYLRDRLTVARNLLTESGSIFVQIGDENVHRVRAMMDEVFGEANFCNQIAFSGTSGFSASLLSRTMDYVLWYTKDIERAKYRALFAAKVLGGEGASLYKRVLTKDGEEVPLGRWMKGKDLSFPIEVEAHPDIRFFGAGDITSQGKASTDQTYVFCGSVYGPGANNHWKPNHPEGLERLAKANRIYATQKNLNYIRFLDDFEYMDRPNVWLDTAGQGQYGETGKIYVVQTANSVIERCIMMTTDPGDLVLDPTCGSGTTATVAEQWGRRWITIDTSRVALALARARIMGARYPYYLLADSPEGQRKEAEITRSVPSTAPTHGDIRHGFVYERVPHITLKSIANNTEIDVIWDKFQQELEPLREQLNKVLDKNWQDWEIPRELPDSVRPELVEGRPDATGKRASTSSARTAEELHRQWWDLRIARQQEIDASIAAKADYEFLYDKPYEDKKKVRVAGPFTVESISPHRVLGVDENDKLIDPNDKNLGENQTSYGERDFTGMILENLKTAGVQQAHKDGRISFTSLTPWPGDLICAEGRFSGQWPVASGQQPDTDHRPPDTEYRAAIFIGPEFGTVSRPDLVEAAREAGDGSFDMLIACAFNYEAHATEFEKLGRIPVLKARMNADLHMADDLKNTGTGNLFVIFGEPDIDILETDDNRIRVKVNGVDVFHPNTGEVRSDGPEGIACWFIDTDYNEESFFVRHAYFLGASDPYKSLRTTLKAEINEEAWATLHSDTSQPFDRPKSGRIAVKVINHLGDEVMKVLQI